MRKCNPVILSSVYGEGELRYIFYSLSNGNGHIQGANFVNEISQNQLANQQRFVTVIIAYPYESESFAVVNGRSN